MAKGENMTVQNGKAISIFFSLKVDRGNKVIASQRQKPLSFIVGEKKMILGLDQELIGLKTGEKKTVKITPESGYGFRDEKLVVPLDRAKIAKDVHMREGMTLQRKTKSGKVMKGHVTSFNDDTVMVDFNHPLAGETLFFETEIVDVREARQ
jgi:FKBP-type peptidyl-prolyl cis-trans isomerase 2